MWTRLGVGRQRHKEHKPDHRLNCRSNSNVGILGVITLIVLTSDILTRARIIQLFPKAFQSRERMGCIQD